MSTNEQALLAVVIIAGMAIFALWEVFGPKPETASDNGKPRGKSALVRVEANTGAMIVYRTKRITNDETWTYFTFTWLYNGYVRQEATVCIADTYGWSFALERAIKKKQAACNLGWDY